MYIYVCVHIHIHTYMPIKRHIYLCTHNTYIFIYVYAYIYTYKLASFGVYICIYMYMYIFLSLKVLILKIENEQCVLQVSFFRPFFIFISLLSFMPLCFPAVMHLCFLALALLSSGRLPSFLSLFFSSFSFSRLRLSCVSLLFLS